MDGVEEETLLELIWHDVKQQRLGITDVADLDNHIFVLISCGQPDTHMLYIDN